MFQVDIPFLQGIAEILPGEPVGAIWNPRPLRVLLVEDGEVNRLVAEGFLARQGHRVTVTGSGEEALAALQAESFDLVLMDLSMPGMGGAEAVKHIRAMPDPDRASTPLIVLSAHVVRSEVARCFEAGADGFLGKPFTPADLSGAIAQCFSERRPTVQAEAEEDADIVPPIIDPSVVRQHLALLGQERAGRIIAAFAENAPPMMDMLRRDFSENAFQRVANQAHALKSAAANVGLARVASLAKRLERAATEGDHPRSATTFAALEAIFASSVDELARTWRQQG